MTKHKPDWADRAAKRFWETSPWSDWDECIERLAAFLRRVAKRHYMRDRTDEWVYLRTGKGKP